MAENLTPKKYIDSNNMKQILTAIKDKTPVGNEYVTEEQLLAKDYATKTYVGEQIVNAEHLKREIVTVLPSDTEASDNVIYMLKVESATGNDKYQEYMKIDGTVQMIGDTSVDLTDYAKTADIPTSLPANGGNADTVNNHTVKSDVPENAVFTDTVYDDTEVKAEIAKKADKSYVDNNFVTMDKIGAIPIEANRTITFSNDYTEISVYRCGYSNIRAHIEIDVLCNIISVGGWVQDMGIVLPEGYRPSENMSIPAWCSSDTEAHTPITLMIGADGKLSGYIGQSHTSINRLNITVTYFK